MKKILVATLLSTSLFAVSAQVNAGNFYVGLGIGQIDVDLGSGISVDEDNPLKFYAGYKFSPTLAAEVHYLNVDIDWETNGITRTMGFKSTGIALVSSLPISPNFSLLGKLGYGKNEATVTVLGNSVSVDDTGTFYGLGVQYNINSNLGIHAEFDKIDVDTRLFTVGANYTF